MSTETVISADVMIRMQEAADRAADGERDPADMDRAFQQMDRMREELRRKIGTVDLAVKLIHDARNP